MTNLPALVNLTPYRGDTWTQVFRLKAGDVPVNLTGATVACWAQPQAGAIVTLEAIISDAVNGEIQISAGVSGLDAGTYTYDVEVTQAAIVTTWIRGTLSVTADITNAPAEALWLT